MRLQLKRLALAALITSSCARPVEPAPELATCAGCNLIIVSLTNVRRDHLSAYGYSRKTSPNLDAFFAGGLRFTRTFATGSWTLPVLGSLYTGLYPYRHGVMSRTSSDHLAEEVTTLAEVLRRRGYRTAAFTGGGDYHRGFNVMQGFDYLIDEENYAGHGFANVERLGRGRRLAYLPIEPLVPVATQWLESHGDKPFFLALQGYDAHCPFRPRPPFDTAFGEPYAGPHDFKNCLWNFGPTPPRQGPRGRLWEVQDSRPDLAAPRVEVDEAALAKMIDLYDGEIAQADAALAGLFETLESRGLLSNTLVVFWSEHGDMLGEHDRFMRGGPHRGTFYEEVLAFPLLLRHPREPGPRDVDQLVDSVDVMPTLLDLLGIADPEGRSRDGRSLAAALRNPSIPGEDLAFAGTRQVGCPNPFFVGVSTAEAIRDRRYKLIHETIFDLGVMTPRYDAWQLFDLEADPREMTNLVDHDPQNLQRLRTHLEERFAKDRPPLLAEPCPTP